MRIILLGDIHIWWFWPRPRQLLGKRLLGQMNLWLNRHSHFDMGLLEALIQEVRNQAPDWVLGSGDLTTTALPQEFALAQRFLAPLLADHRAFLIPGNHDRYTPGATRSRRFEAAFGPQTAQTWPHTLALDDDTLLIALDAARPHPFNASGILGPEQLEALERILAQAQRRRLILLCHYDLGTPPASPTEAWSHRLQDAQDLRKILAGCPRQILYLHGHVHQPWCWRPVQTPNVLDINAGAPVMTSPAWLRGQGFWRIETDGDFFKCFHHHSDPAGIWQTRPVAMPIKAGELSPVNN